MLYATTGKSIEVVTFCRTFAYHGSATTNGDRHATPISRERLEALKTCPFYYNLLPHHYANVINFINSSLDQYYDNTTRRENKRNFTKQKTYLLNIYAFMFCNCICF